MWADAAASPGTISRKGLGKTRRVNTGLFWIEQTEAEKRLKCGKALGRENPTDLYTKPRQGNHRMALHHVVCRFRQLGWNETAPGPQPELKATWEMTSSMPLAADQTSRFASGLNPIPFILILRVEAVLKERMQPLPKKPDMMKMSLA